MTASNWDVGHTDEWGIGEYAQELMQDLAGLISQSL